MAEHERKWWLDPSEKDLAVVLVALRIAAQFVETGQQKQMQDLAEALMEDFCGPPHDPRNGPFYE